MEKEHTSSSQGSIPVVKLSRSELSRAGVIFIRAKICEPDEMPLALNGEQPVVSGVPPYGEVMARGLLLCEREPICSMNVKSAVVNYYKLFGLPS